MKKWSVELTCGSESLGDVGIKRGIFQGDSNLSPLPLCYMFNPTYVTYLRRCAAGYEFSSNGSKINHLLFMDDLKLYEKSTMRKLGVPSHMTWTDYRIGI